MFKPTPFALGAIAVFSGLAAAALTIDRAGVRAQDSESALEFSVRQQRHKMGERGAYYAREPRRVSRDGAFGRGFFGQLFGFDGYAEPVPQQRTAAPADLKRAVCRRTCDGSQLVLGFVSSRGDQKDAEAMCAVAGGGAPTVFALERFEPAQESAPEQIASTSPALIEGRASLTPNAAGRAAGLGGNCAGASEPMVVPILHDTTLRRGDVVATRGGFRVFVGKGKPPFRESDFVALDESRKISRELRGMKVADR